MRILVVCGDRGVPALGPSGSSVHLRGIVAAMVARGHDVRLAVPRLADARGIHGHVPVPVVTAEPRRWGWLPRRWRDRGEALDGRRLVRRAAAWRPDLVWERHALFCRAEIGVPRLLEVNAPLSLERTDVHDPRYAERIERASLLGATRVIAVSSWLRSWAIGLGCAPSRVIHVPNGTSLPHGDRARGRARHGLSGLVVGFVGSMKPWHGVERIPAMLGGATGVLIGDGPVRVDGLRSLGRLEGQDLADAVAALDVGLAPYPPHAPPWFCPLKVLDYRAQGVPVVGADVGDTRALVGPHGVLLTDDDPRAWARAIRMAATLPRVPAPRPWTAVVDEALSALTSARGAG